VTECSICGCDPCASRTFCSVCRKADQDRAAGKPPTQTGGRWWPIRTMSPEVLGARQMTDPAVSLEEAKRLASEGRPTPKATVDAVMHSVLKRGLRALTESANLERLARCDAAAKTEIEQRIAKLIAKGMISDVAA
jgi:hypothetical protein